MVAAEDSGPTVNPLEVVPSIPFLLQTEKQRLTANLGSFQHFLIVGAHLAFKDVGNEEFLSGELFRRGRERDLDDPPLRIDLD